jgi:two-component system sensor histidine kinase BaeS
MKRPFDITQVGLRTKLTLSLLLVTIGAILILSIVISLAVQSFYREAQHDNLRQKALYFAGYYENKYRQQGYTWGNKYGTLVSSEPEIQKIVDASGQDIICFQPYGFVSCKDPTLTDALHKSLNGQEGDGYLNVSTPKGSFLSIYISVPMRINGQIIGALFISDPKADSDALINRINSSIELTALIVGSLVLLFSLLLTRSMTRPLKWLTLAAEQMKQGKYAQRVPVPAAQDELGLLAQTFNEMADTIESDVNELRRQEQARRELLANIAHDLATPLTAIQGFSEALADDMIQDPSARQETAQRIGREVQRLRRMVADLQQMTSLESGRTRLDLAPLSLHELIAETLAVIEPECEHAGIVVHNETRDDIPLVQADSDRVTQVLLNLLDNARRHTPVGGTITVGAHPGESGQSVEVWIEDTGVGIDSADLPHIFERFYRADRSRTGATGGSGLGLSIVRAIITAHGGKVWARSTPGEGTRISFSLPMAEKALLPAQV